MNLGPLYLQPNALTTNLYPYPPPSQLVLGSWLNMLGAVLRYIAVLKLIGMDDRFQFPVMMLGQTLCSLAQPLVIFTPTKLTAVWFPDHQRATANMIASMCELLYAWTNMI